MNWNPLLREYSDFSGKDDTVCYIRKEVPSEELEREHSLHWIAGKRDVFDRAVRLPDWLSAQVRHRGDYDNSDPRLFVEAFYRPPVLETE